MACHHHQQQVLCRTPYVFQWFSIIRSLFGISLGTLIILRSSLSFLRLAHFLFPPGDIQHSTIFECWSLRIHKISPTICIQRSFRVLNRCSKFDFCSNSSLDMWSQYKTWRIFLKQHYWEIFNCLIMLVVHFHVSQVYWHVLSMKKSDRESLSKNNCGYLKDNMFMCAYTFSCRVLWK